MNPLEQHFLDQVRKTGWPRPDRIAYILRAMVQDRGALAIVRMNHPPMFIFEKKLYRANQDSTFSLLKSAHA